MTLRPFVSAFVLASCNAPAKTTLRDPAEAPYVLELTHGTSTVRVDSILTLLKARHGAKHPETLDAWIVDRTTRFCAPCTWMSPDMDVEDMYPLDRLDHAVGARCMPS